MLRHFSIIDNENKRFFLPGFRLAPGPAIQNAVPKRPNMKQRGTKHRSFVPEQGETAETYN
jgi:hypothetical protein